MNRNRLVMVISAFLLLLSLPFGEAVAEGLNPALPEQAASVSTETISASGQNAPRLSLRGVIKT